MDRNERALVAAEEALERARALCVEWSQRPDVATSVAYFLPWQNRAFAAGVNASRDVSLRALLAALDGDGA